MRIAFLLAGLLSLPAAEDQLHRARGNYHRVQAANEITGDGVLDDAEELASNQAKAWYCIAAMLDPRYSVEDRQAYLAAMDAYWGWLVWRES